MRQNLTLIGLFFVLSFAVLTLVGMQSAIAGEGDDDDVDPGSHFPCARDDGDNGDPNDGDVPDDPDSEDNQELGFQGIFPDADNPEEGDPEDDDPYYEDDDCPAPLEPGECGAMTATGLYFFSEYNYQGSCIFLPPLPGSQYWALQYICNFGQCTWNDIPSSLKLVGNLPNVYVCLHDPPNYPGGFCVHVPGDIPDLNSINLDNNITTIFYNGDPLGVSLPGTVVPEAPQDEVSFAAADADCDGGVGVADALTNLQYLSGFEVGCAGDWNGESYQGDADCSGAVEGGDVTAILLAVMSGASTDC